MKEKNKKIKKKFPRLFKLVTYSMRQLQLKFNTFFLIVNP